jgi:hypothetical protein
MAEPVAAAVMSEHPEPKHALVLPWKRTAALAGVATSAVDATNAAGMIIAFIKCETAFFIARLLLVVVHWQKIEIDRSDGSHGDRSPRRSPIDPVQELGKAFSRIERPGGAQGWPDKVTTAQR